MDTPTHALINRLIVRRIWPDRQDDASVNLVTAMGVIPDVDTFFAGDDLAFIQDHRGITHSVFGVAVFGVVVALVAGRLGVRGPFSRRYVLSVCGMLLHILFDVVTFYGTQVLAPFSDHRFAVDVLFVIDPYLTGLLILALVAGWKLRPEAYRIGFAVFLAYVSMNFALYGYGHLQARQWAEDTGLNAERIAVLPMPFSPLHRRAFVESEETTYWVTIPAFGAPGATVERFPRAVKQDDLAFVWETEIGKTYHWFSRYPVITSSEGSIRIVEDLSYKNRGAGLGWIGQAVLNYAEAGNPDFLDQRKFYLKVDVADGDVTFSR